MKTQIITLATHDDLISIRDRMSWAKAPQILLVWPPREQVALQPLDLRILQNHARELGAELGLVARAGSIRRDAKALGIPVFASSIEAQRQPWGHFSRRFRRGSERRRATPATLRDLQVRVQPSNAAWTSSSVARLASFGVAVLSVLALASLFIPRAEVILAPETQEQRLTLTVDVRSAEGDVPVQGGLPAQLATTSVSGTQTLPVLTRVQVAATKAKGIARFQNLTAAPLTVPVGTVVYSLEPTLLQFSTLEEARLDGGASNVLEIPIEALQAGQESNLPPGAIDGVEGSLSASVNVTNSEPIAGGTNEAQSVPSETDRQHLRALVVQALQAQAAIDASLPAGDVLVPGSLALKSIQSELYDPPSGQAGTVLSLTLEATYEAQYVRGADLQALANLALDAEMPPDYAPERESLRLQVNQVSPADSGKAAQLQLDLQRTLRRRIDEAGAADIVRGTSVRNASRRLEEALPLTTTPEIRMTPSWWPWMPLIPFRIDLVLP